MLEKDSEMVIALCLHENAHLMEQTACLLNSEWPRNMTARLRSLECSDNQAEIGFPVSLLLVRKINGVEEVIGHSKVMLIHNQVGACFVESVVINKRMRGKGYGKLIMERSEEYVRRRGITSIYLTTLNEEGFYTKLGYETCPPIMFSGSGSAAIQEKFKLLGISCKIDELGQSSVGGQSEKRNYESESSQEFGNRSSQVPSSKPSPPPPPSLPLSLNSPPSNNVHKVYMKKVL